MNKIDLNKVKHAAKILSNVIYKTPLILNQNKSKTYEANVYFKREDLQQVRSYKIRGAYHKISSLSENKLKNGIVCASAGNHAQGFAFTCSTKKIKGIVFMPNPTPNQKIEQVKMFGGEYIKIILTGDTFDDAFDEAIKYS